MSPAATEFLTPATAFSRSSSRSPRSTGSFIIPSPIKIDGSKCPLSFKNSFDSLMSTNHQIAALSLSSFATGKLANCAMNLPKTPPRKRSSSDDDRSESPLRKIKKSTSPEVPGSLSPRKSARTLIPKFAVSPDSDLLRFLVKNRLDDECSRDSGFESNDSSGISSARSSETGSVAGSFPPTKAVNSKRCNWKNCLEPDIGEAVDIWDHLNAKHVETCRPVSGRGRKKCDGKFCCLWVGCKAFNTPPTRGDQAQRFSWLESHVLEKHGGPKPHRCILEGCSDRFASKVSLNTHLASSHLGNECSRNKQNSIETDKILPVCNVSFSDDMNVPSSTTKIQDTGISSAKVDTKVKLDLIIRRRKLRNNGSGNHRPLDKYYIDFTDQCTVNQLIYKVAQWDRRLSKATYSEQQRKLGANNSVAYLSGSKGHRMNSQRKSTFPNAKRPSHQTVERQSNTTGIQGHLALIFPNTVGAKLNRIKMRIHAQKG